MKKRISACAILLGMIILLLWTSYSMIVQSPEEHNISVVLTGSDHDRWFAVKEGMKQAAFDYSVNIKFCEVKQYPTTNDEWDIIDQELEQGADSVIVEPVGKQLLQQEEFNENLPIVLLDSDIEPEGVYTCVHADDEKIGRMLFDKVYEVYGDQLAHKKIGIVAGEASKMAMNQRLKGFYAGMEEHGLRQGWTMGLGRNLEEHLKVQLKRSRPDIIVALGSLETEIVVDQVVANGMEKQVDIYGEGYSEKTVYYLGQEVIDCLVMSNEFAMGYLAVQKAAESSQHSLFQEETGTIDLHSVRSNELYDEENQKILFPHIR